MNIIIDGIAVQELLQWTDLEKLPQSLRLYKSSFIF